MEAEARIEAVSNDTIALLICIVLGIYIGVIAMVLGYEVF